MQSFLSALNAPIATVVHIGAGNGDDLQAYLEAGAGTVLLAEANPEAAACLETRVAEYPNISVVAAAVSADPEKRPFRHTNFPELDSFRAPTGLKELFPGLRDIAQDPVTPMDPAKLLEGLALDGEGHNLLVLETPGESLGILQALAAAELLTRFDAVRLREGRTALYDGAATVAEIGAYLAGLGFATSLEPAPEDPERPYLEARLDRAWMVLKQERDALAEALGDAEAEKQALAAQTKTLEQETGALRTQLGEVQEQAKERDGRIETLVAERDKVANETEALRKQLAEVQEQSKTRAGRIETLVAERDKAATEAEALRKQLAEVQEQAKTRAGRIETLVAERDKAATEAEALRKQLGEVQEQAKTRAGRIEALIAERDKVANETEALRKQLAEVQEQSKTRAGRIETLVAERDKAATEAEALRKQLGQAQSRQEDLETKVERLAGVRDEIIKAEGQIGLIRDLLWKGERL